MFFSLLKGGKTAEEEGGRSLEHITEGTETVSLVTLRQICNYLKVPSIIITQNWLIIT